MPLDLYHGTSLDTARALVREPRQVSVALGGGELGRGFYAGTHLFQAAIWAKRKYGAGGVVHLSIESSAYELLDRAVLDREAVIATWLRLRQNGTHRTHVFGVDAVEGPFATLPTGVQHKFESLNARQLLHDSTWQLVPLD